MRILALLVSGIVPLFAAPIGQEEKKVAPPVVGDEAPPLTIESIVDPKGRLPAKGPIPREKLAGKVVVLDFSTSWCAGCVMSVPHMNALVREFAADESVVFLTVTNEGEAAATAFREKSKIESAFGRDEDGSTFEDYWVNAIPGVVIIGGDGKIAALLFPDHVTARVIKDVKAGGRVAKSDWPAERIRRNWDVCWMEKKEGPASVGVRVTKTDKAGGQSRTDPRTGELKVSGLPAGTLIAVALGVSPRDVDFKGEKPEGWYDMVAMPPDGSIETVRELARRALEEELKVTIERATVKKAGLLLRRLPDAAPLPPAEARGGSSRPGSIDMPKATMPQLAKTLGSFTDKPLGDATGLTGEFMVKLEWDPRKGGDALKEALRASGFELTAGDVEVPSVVVTPRP